MKYLYHVSTVAPSVWGLCPCIPTSENECLHVDTCICVNAFLCTYAAKTIRAKNVYVKNVNSLRSTLPQVDTDPDIL